MANRSVQVVISAQDNASSVMSKIQQRFGELNRETERASSKFTQMNSALSALGGALSMAGLAAVTKSFIEAGMQVEKLNKLFSAAAGSANLGGREFDYIKQVSDKMGLSVQTTAESYGKFMAAIRNTTLEGEQGRKVFESVSGAASALGLSADETSGIFNALQQMMSKGKVQAEELRGQLGERLPGAFKMAADAMGVTTAQLDKMLQDGKVLASDLLPKLAVELDKTYGAAAKDGATSAAAEFARFKNAIFESSAAVGTALLPAFSSIMRGLTSMVDMLRQFIAGFQILAIKAAAIPDQMSAAWSVVKSGKGLFTKEGQAMFKELTKFSDQAVNDSIDELMKKYMPKDTSYTESEKARQKAIKPQKVEGKPGKTLHGSSQWTYEDDKLLKNILKYQEFLGEGWSEVYQLALQDQEKMYQGWSDVYQLELQDQENAYQAMSDRYQEVLMEQQAAYGNSPWQGLKAGIDDYAKSVASVGDMYRDLATGAMQQATEALTRFVMTGKLSFKDFADSIISELVRIQMRMMVSGIFNMIGNAFSGWMSGMSSDQVAMANNPPNISGARADGGPVSGGSTYLIGERGPELFTPGASGMITPNHALVGNMALTVNVVNQSGQQVKAKEGGTSFDGKSMVKTIILEAMDTDPSFRWAMRGAA